mmetsp:Transcript_109032/g.319124  ORF Transcript_109032/g.319124 Transcript_109032/m.319124 type:complete len:254 (+) Transcript_109032:1121-1882(+)
MPPAGAACRCRGLDDAAPRRGPAVPSRRGSLPQAGTAGRGLGHAARGRGPARVPGRGGRVRPAGAAGRRGRLEEAHRRRGPAQVPRGRGLGGAAGRRPHAEGLVSGHGDLPEVGCVAAAAHAAGWAPGLALLASGLPHGQRHLERVAARGSGTERAAAGRCLHQGADRDGRAEGLVDWHGGLDGLTSRREHLQRQPGGAGHVVLQVVVCLRRLRRQALHVAVQVPQQRGGAGQRELGLVERPVSVGQQSWARW